LEETMHLSCYRIRDDGGDDDDDDDDDDDSTEI